MATARRVKRDVSSESFVSYILVGTSTYGSRGGQSPTYLSIKSWGQSAKGSVDLHFYFEKLPVKAVRVLVAGATGSPPSVKSVAKAWLLEKTSPRGFSWTTFPSDGWSASVSLRVLNLASGQSRTAAPQPQPSAMRTSSLALVTVPAS